MADFPTTYPSFTDLDGNQTLAANNHAARHNKVHREVEAIAQRVGKTGDTDPTTHENKIADLQSASTATNANVATNTANIATNTTNIATNAAAITALGAAVVRIADTDASGYGFVLNDGTMAANSATKIPTQQSVKTYVDVNKKYYGLVNGSINTSNPGGYTVVALSTPCTVTVPVISGAKYLVTTSNTYMQPYAATGQIDYGPGVGTTAITSGTYGASTGTYGLPITSRAVYTAASTTNITFQVILGSAAAVTIRVDNPMITVERVY